MGTGVVRYFVTPESLRSSLKDRPNAADAAANCQSLSEMRQKLAMQMEQLRGCSAV